MRSIVIIFYALTVCVVSQAQSQNAQAQLTLGRMKTLGSVGLYSTMDEMTPEGKVVGSPYLKDEWETITLVMLNNEVLENYPVRYDIYHNTFEVKVGETVKGLEGKLVKEFSSAFGNELNKRKFVNASSLKVDGTPLTGFVEVLSDGALKLIRKTDIVVRKPDYSVQFSVGSRDTQLSQRATLMYVKQDEVYELPKNSRRMAAIFGDKQSEVLKYMDNNNIRLRDEYDLRNVFDFFNGLPN